MIYGRNTSRMLKEFKRKSYLGGNLRDTSGRNTCLRGITMGKLRNYMTISWGRLPWKLIPLIL